MQHAPGSRSNILPGSAPALHSVILYPFFPLPLPLHTTPSPSPRPLARNPHPAPVESTFAPKLARIPPFPAQFEAKRIAHSGTGFSSRRPVPGAVTGFGNRPGTPAHGHKKRALDGSKTLKKYYVMPPDCVSESVRQAVRFLTNCHTGSRSCGSNSSCPSSSPSPSPRSGGTPWRPGTAPCPSGPGRRSS